MKRTWERTWSLPTDDDAAAAESFRCVVDGVTWTLRFATDNFAYVDGRLVNEGVGWAFCVGDKRLAFWTGTVDVPPFKMVERFTQSWTGGHPPMLEAAS